MTVDERCSKLGPRRVVAKLMVLQAELFVREAVLGISCRIMVIYLTKFRKENSIFRFVYKC